MRVPKILFIRFSSLGDVVQALSLPVILKRFQREFTQPDEAVQVHFVTKKQYSSLAQGHPYIDCIWEYDTSSGWLGLWKLIRALQKEKFTHIYDSHNHLRSRIIGLFLRSPFDFGLDFSRILSPPLFLRKAQFRWKRFLLFRFGINLFPQPFSGQRDLIAPLGQWGLPVELPLPPQIFVSNSAVQIAQNRVDHLSMGSSFVVCATSSAHPLKCWPMEHWQELWRNNPQIQFVLLGDPPSRIVMDTNNGIARENIVDWRGTTELSEAAALILLSRLVIANDTGLLHIAEQLGKPAIALMGPAPFGFPSRPTTEILQVQLPCRPCSKHGQGPCRNSEFQKCMRDISPQWVAKVMDLLLTLR